MFVLSLCKQFCPEKIPAKAGERLSFGGADGEIFTIIDEPTKVIKLSVIYDRTEVSPKEMYFKQVAPVLNYVMLNTPSMCATIYEHGYLGEYSRKLEHWRKGKQTFIIHYCIMEKLNQLSEDEKKVFYTLVSHEDRNIEKNLSPLRIKEIVDGLVKGLDFDEGKVMLFCDQLRGAKIKQSDLHPRNILKNTDGNFKLIDFDRSVLID